MARRQSSASSAFTKLRLGPLIMLRGDEVDFNPWNPNRMDAFMEAKAAESIEQFGMVDPVLVREVKGPIPYQMIDGEHRARACITANTLIPAHSVGAIDDTLAKKLTIALNEIHGNADPADMGKLLDDLMATSSMDELLAGLPMTEDTVKAFTNAAGIDWPGDAEAPGSPAEVPGTPGTPERWVERTYRVPSSVAEVLDQALGKAKRAIEADGSIATDARALEVIAAEYMAS
jgi:hypothetical protein